MFEENVYFRLCNYNFEKERVMFDDKDLTNSLVNCLCREIPAIAFTCGSIKS